MSAGTGTAGLGAMAEGVAPRWLAALVVALLLGLIGLAERRGPQP